MFWLLAGAGASRVSDSGLGLATVPWEGGPAYWAQFAKADAAGWSDPSFFPIAIFLGKPEAGHPAALAALGINVYMAAEHNPPVSAITSAGIFVLANPDNPYTTPAESGWDTGDIGSNANVVGWFICDEPDMGYGGYIGTEDEDGYLAAVEALAATARALDDGRFVFCNFGNGILNTFWSPNTMDDMIDAVDGCSIDKYPYTSPQVRFEYGRSDDWIADGGTEANSQSAAAYGWNCRRFHEYWVNPSNRRPIWGFVETKMPLLVEDDRSIITYAQIEGAVWSQIVNEARGMAYFQHNGNYGAGAPATDPNTGSAPDESLYSLIECEVALATAITAINTKLALLAPVINTQSYVHNFGAAGMDTMLKVHEGFAYIFASVGIAASTGSKSFTLPAGISGTSVEVVSESRSVSVSGGAFSDTFANEYTHHVYKVAI